MKNGGTLRTALFALAVLVLMAAPALASSDGVISYRALLIGNSDYQAQLDLSSCAYDLTAMRSALTSGTVSYKKTASYSNQTQADIGSKVNGVLTWGADDDDVTVFYYTGHGASGGLVGVDHSSSKNGIYPFSQLQSVLSNVRGKVIVLLDSCESGGLINKSAAAADSFTDGAIAAFSGASSGGPSAKAITSGSKFHVIASSSKSQLSWAKTNLYGLTTWALCEAMGWSHNGPDAGNRLESLEGDVNGNGDLTVTVGEAYSYAAQAVSAELDRYGYTQDMKAYPENSSLMLITRAAVPPAPVETPKAVYRPGVLNFSKACIAPGKKLQLQLNVEGATQVHWSTSKSSVATVDENTGLVTGVKYSYSVVPRILVNYYVGSSSFYAYCDFRVLPARYVVQSVILKDAKPLEKGLSYTVPAKVTPSSAWYKSLRWSTSNSSVATVHPTSGRITAVAESGTAEITATALSGVTATVTVTAAPAQPRSVSLEYKTRTLMPGGSCQLTATVSPTYAVDKTVTWKSSNPSVADVDKDGNVTTNRGFYGRAVITATTENNKRATCVITVLRNESTLRTRPRSVYGQLTSSARRIYYNRTGSLVIEMYFSNRTRHSEMVPMYNKGVVVLKLRNKSVVPIPVTVTGAKPLRSGAWTGYKFMLNFEDYPDIPNLPNLDLRGSDARYEAIN